jgi:RNA polymerase sigma-70 factor (ECF subfamily)
LDKAPSREFASFMQAYQDMVFSTIVRLTGNDSQAEDIAQEVFLKAYENFTHLRVSKSAGGWLKTVATHRTINYLSRYRNRWRLFSELRRDDDEEFEPPASMDTPDALLLALDAEQRHALVERCLKALPEAQRVPLALFHFSSMPYEDIARHLGISLAKVKVDIHRGRVALAQALSRSGVASAGGGA